MKFLSSLLGLLLLAGPAAAQSNPGLIRGQVPTAAQWNSYFAAKQDTLPYVPLNRAGDTMLGPLITAPSTTAGAGLRVPPGGAPTTPVDGDVWTTASGAFVRVNGTTQSVVFLPSGGTSGQALISNGASPPTFGVLQLIGGGCGSTSAAGCRSNLGLGSMSLQNSGTVAITGGTITGMGTPSAASDVATKGYVDSSATGLHILAQSRLATAAVLPNTPTYSNGTLGVGATLTAGSNGALTVDGVAVTAADQILVKDQASALQNGIYTVTNAGSGGAPYVLTRVTFFDQASEMISGSYTLVTAGTANAGASWTLATTVTTVGTDALNFNQFSPPAVTSLGAAVGNITLGNGLAIAGNVLSSTTCGTNTNSAAKTGAYAVLNSDKGSVIALSGTFYAATFTAATNYDSTYCVQLLNTDTVNAKDVVLPGYSNIKLYPLQLMTVRRQGTAWYENHPPRWKHPGGPLNVYVDAGGSDSNDGLTIASAKATPSGCLFMLGGDVDFSFVPQTTAWCRLTANGFFTDGIHYSSHAQVGAQGGAAIKIGGDGGIATIATSGTPPIGLFVDSTIQLENLLLTNSAGPCLVAGYRTYVQMLAGMNFGTCTSSFQMAATESAVIIIGASYKVSGGGAYHMVAQNGGKILSTGNVNATFTGTGSGTNLTVTQVAGTIAVGDTVNGSGVPGATTIVSQSSGTTGGAGVYVTSGATTASSASLYTSNATGLVAAATAPSWNYAYGAAAAFGGIIDVAITFTGFANSGGTKADAAYLAMTINQSTACGGFPGLNPGTTSYGGICP